MFIQLNLAGTLRDIMEFVVILKFLARRPFQSSAIPSKYSHRGESLLILESLDLI